MEIKKPIDIKCIFNSIFHHKKAFIYGIPVSFVISCCLILCVPRYYTCTVSLAPETLNANSSSLSSLASSFGVNLSNKLGEMSDAFFPEIYPDILKTTNFKLSLFSIPVKTIDGKVNSDYYTYMEKYQKYPWWTTCLESITHLFSTKDESPSRSGRVDSFSLTKKQMNVIGLMDKNISCNVDKRTGIISISVNDQDPLVCATIADSVRCKLQNFIIDYRTSKARADVKYTHGLYVAAKQQYEKARQQYASFSDSHVDAVLASVSSKQEDYENEMQLQYNNYSNWAMQYQSALARVREKTPAFTVLQTACVPLKPAGPKRMLFVLAVVLVAFIGLTIYAVYKDTKTQVSE